MNLKEVISDFCCVIYYSILLLELTKCTVLTAGESRISTGELIFEEAVQKYMDKPSGSLSVHRGKNTENNSAINLLFITYLSMYS